MISSVNFNDLEPLVCELGSVSLFKSLHCFAHVCRSSLYICLLALAWENIWGGPLNEIKSVLLGQNNACTTANNVPIPQVNLVRLIYHAGILFDEIVLRLLLPEFSVLIFVGGSLIIPSIDIIHHSGPLVIDLPCECLYLLHPRFPCWIKLDNVLQVGRVL